MPPFFSTIMIIDDTEFENLDFIKAHIQTLKTNLLNCHNELQMLYGELNTSKKYIGKLEAENINLKIKLTVNGINYDEKGI
jgi:hypothetical protein